MIVCKKCNKAMKSETATEFCKCCYPEPEEVKRVMSATDVISWYKKTGELPPKDFNPEIMDRLKDEYPFAPDLIANRIEKKLT